MSFDINGFLDEEINEVIKGNYSKYKQLFQLCEDLNRYFIETSKRISLKEDDTRGATIFCLLIKILNACQGVVILSKYGLDIEAMDICRTALESLFYLAAIIKNEEFFNDFIKAKKLILRKILRKIKDNPSCYPDEDLYTYYMKFDDDEKIKDYHIFDVAERADLKDIYITAYKYLCSITHTNVVSLQMRYLIEEGIAKRFDLKPSTKDMKLILNADCHIMWLTIYYLSKYFEISQGIEFYTYMDRLNGDT